MILTIIAVSLALFSFAFLYIYYFTPEKGETRNEQSPPNDLKSLSEQAVKKIERDINAIENELKDDFYKSLQKHIWSPDVSVPGNKNPFAK